MCGFIAAITLGDPPATARLLRGLDHMARRGPDAQGDWQEGEVFLGHRRLAIIDLDVRSAQPYHSECGRYVIIFNGEIYNFLELKSELLEKGVRFSTTSDTEVLLALFIVDGAAMLPRLRGMFAFVVWDREQHKAFAARDAYGIKPLYVASNDQGIMLASQVKALLATGLVSREPDYVGQAGFWMLGSVPEPHTWFRDIQAVPAGHFLWVEEGRVVQQQCWFDVGSVWRAAATFEPLCLEEVQALTRSALLFSVTEHLVADVPVGVFLSGGIDSTALAALMMQQGAGDLQGITLTYDEFAGMHEDEMPIASQAAQRYGLTHHSRRVTRQEFDRDRDRILTAMDQPSVDGVNTWYASKAVSERGLKVVVSGVGGDELFFGYSTFLSTPQLVRRRHRFGAIPGASRLANAVGHWEARRTGKGRWRFATEWSRTLEGAWWLSRSIHAPDELPTLMGREQAALGLRDFDVSAMMERMVGKLAADPMLAVGQMESMAYMRNQLLRDSDWASMDHSVELRTPLVDLTLLKTLAPVLRSFSQYPGKALLAQAPAMPLPDSITGRRKTGFGIPVQKWLGGSVAGIEKTDKGWVPWMRTIANHYAVEG